MPALPPSNVGLISALHEEVREGSGSPRGEGSGQYRERLDHRLIHSGGQRRVHEKAPALSMFSPVNTEIALAFSTGVEEVGD
jgi:hypothetical protein